MMHRPAFASSAKSFRDIATSAAQRISEAAADTVTALFVQLGIMALAERENRRRNRFSKRQNRNSIYRESGLNGKRAVERRLRQIAKGSLRVENGLVV